MNAVITGAKSNELKPIHAMVKKASAEIGHEVDFFRTEFCDKTYSIKIPKSGRRKTPDDRLNQRRISELANCY
ncbi:hypothetical protein [Pseudomonas viridiflava]|uniref:hypothetical protein n=2 Tax=Pseudomonas viridiflava TaxID=33069 RepID=UPI0013CE4D87|nr:hypothetical protein [Pseudomonas viridiflava]